MEPNSRTKGLLQDYSSRKQTIENKKPDFESPMAELARMIRVLDEKCPHHPETHLQAFSGRVVCVSCQREKIAAEEEERVKKAAFRYHKRTTYERLYRDSILTDATLKDASFQSFIADNEEARMNKESARQIAGSYLKGETFNTLLTGNAGAGKSHLAMSILKAVNENADPWKSCIFLTLDEFLLEIRNTFGDDSKTNKENEKTIIDRYAFVDLLVIDDLGSETAFFSGTNDDQFVAKDLVKIKRASDFTQRVLFNLMSKRQDKSTIVTTNLSSQLLTAMYDQKVISRLERGIQGHIITFKESKDRRIFWE